MRSSAPITLFCILLGGMTVANAVMKAGTDSATGPKTVEQCIEIAESLNLEWLSEPSDELQSSVLLSYRPIAQGSGLDLWMHDPEPEHWRGIVRIYLNQADLYQLNYDPEEPGRIAQWGEVCVYGDPELISMLLEHRS